MKPFKLYPTKDQETTLLASARTITEVVNKLVPLPQAVAEREEKAAE